MRVYSEPHRNCCGPGTQIQDLLTDMLHHGSRDISDISIMITGQMITINQFFAKYIVGLLKSMENCCQSLMLSDAILSFQIGGSQWFAMNTFLRFLANILMAIGQIQRRVRSDHKRDYRQPQIILALNSQYSNSPQITNFKCVNQSAQSLTWAWFI